MDTGGAGRVGVTFLELLEGLCGVTLKLESNEF